MGRQLIVVDCETTGLHANAAILEIAAVNVHTGQELYFVPYVSQKALGKAAPDAMKINRYYERGVYSDRLSPLGTAEHYAELRQMLADNTFGGSNPTFDSRLVQRQSCDHIYPQPMGEVWHHRLASLEAYAGPAMGREPWNLPGNAAVCDFLGVTIDGEHTALGDARATAQCFQKLIDHYESANS